MENALVAGIPNLKKHMPTLYKIVRRKSKKLVSFSVFPGEWKNQRTMRYLTTKVNRPPKDGNPCLFCFDNLDDTIKFLISCSGKMYENVVYECTTSEVIDTLTVNDEAALLSGVPLTRRFDGTVLVKDITLTKRVGVWNYITRTLNPK